MELLLFDPLFRQLRHHRFLHSPLDQKPRHDIAEILLKVALNTKTSHLINSYISILSIFWTSLI
jgi:hypothetical protein